MVIIIRIFHISGFKIPTVGNGRGQKSVRWWSEGKTDAFNRFVMPKNMALGYPHAIVIIIRIFHISGLKIPTVGNGRGQKSVRWWSEGKTDAFNWFVMPKNIGLEYPHAMIIIIEWFNIFGNKFPRSQKGVAI